MSTIGDIFAGAGLTQWWNNPTQFFGQNGEMGTDYSMGGTGQPVGAIQGGQVVYVGAPYANDPNHSSLGYVVQILGPDGNLYHYQHLESPNVQQGDTIQPGQVVGLSGGCPVGAYNGQGGCNWTDAWSTGPHIEVRLAPYNANGGVWNQAWQNPYSTFLQMGGGTPTTTPTGTGGGQSPQSANGSTAATISTGLTSFAQRAGIFVLSLVLVGAGAFLLFKNQIEGAAKKGVEVAAA